MYTRVLVCVDGSEAAGTAARSGLDIARAFGATVDALHVVQRGWLRAGDGERLRERGQDALADVASAAESVEVRTELREGGPAERISEFAREREADLVVVGRQGLTGLGERLLGGVAERLLHRCSVPVLVVPPEAGQRGGYERLLLPTDGSDNAAAAAPHAGAVADRYGAAVHVLNVLDLQAAGGLFDAGGLDRAFVERLENEGREAVEALAGDLREDGVATETGVVRAPGEGAAAGIREYVAEERIDLVAMGTRGRSNLGRGVLGSVASAVLRTVDVPVLAVPPA